MSKRSRSRKEELFRQMEGVAAAKESKATSPIKRRKPIKAIAAILLVVAAAMMIWLLRS
jgi:ferric-dicitrate binding protein FerR (iron transport regulator)